MALANALYIGTGQQSQSHLDAGLDNYEAANSVIDNDIGRIVNIRLQGRAFSSILFVSDFAVF